MKRRRVESSISFSELSGGAGTRASLGTLLWVEVLDQTKLERLRPTDGLGTSGTKLESATGL